MTWQLLAVYVFGLFCGAAMMLFIVAIVTVGSWADERMGYDR